MKMKKPKYVQSFRDRHNRERCYYRRNGQRQPIDGVMGSPDWMSNYLRIHRSFEKGPLAVPDHETLRFATQEYLASRRYNKLTDETKANYRSVVDELRDKLGDQPLQAFTRGSVVKLRDTIAERSKSKAALAVKVLRMIFEVACDNDVIDRNPAKGVLAPDGFKSIPHRKWSDEEIAAFVERGRPHAKRAMMVLLYTGLRAKDAPSLKRNAVKDGVIRLKPSKGGKPLVIPVHADLKAELQRSWDVETMHLICGARGHEINRHGLLAMIKREFDRLGFDDHPTVHGLRKNAVVSLIEAGCSPRQVQSITGQSLQMVEYYASDYEREQLSKEAIQLWEKR